MPHTLGPCRVSERRGATGRLLFGAKTKKNHGTVTMEQFQAKLTPRQSFQGLIPKDPTQGTC